MSRIIKPKFQVVHTDKNNFLMPLFAPDIQAIILAHGLDEGIKTYTVMRLLRIYIFSGILPGFFKPLRGVASLCGNFLAQQFVGLRRWTRTGLSDANKRVPYTVFKEIYEKLSTRVTCCFSKSKLDKAFGDFKIFDSTCLQLCLNLVSWGKPQNQRSMKGQMKVSLRIDEGGMIPNQINIDSNFTHDDVHFKDLIDWTKKGFTYLFDRGFRRIQTLVDIHNSRNFFITRWNQSISITPCQDLPLCRERRGHLEVIGDQKVRLGKNKKRSGILFRFITVISYLDKEPKVLFFLTNRFDLCPFDVAEIYRQRWQIEIFFKWLKSQLKINHLISYDENGVYSQIYITLILNLLLAIYHTNRAFNWKLGINTQRELMNELLNYAIRMGMAIEKSKNMSNKSNELNIQNIHPIPVKLTCEIIKI